MSRSGGVRCGTEAGLIAEQASADTVHHGRSHHTASRLPDAEGGINDEADQPKVVENYPEHIANLRRTNFAGALAYLVKVLRGRFPHARIYAVTPGGLYYGHTDRPFDFIVKSEQIRRAASLIGIPTIDWDREGRLSFVFNNSKGTGNGSDSNPFIYNVPSLETGDLLHPNERGGRYLAENVVAELNRQVLKKPSAE